MTEPVFIHPQGIVEAGAKIGPGSQVWAFAHVLAGAQIGSGCTICDHVFVENQVRIGDRVTVKNGVQLRNGIQLEDDVFVGPNAAFTNDDLPHNRQYPGGTHLQTIVRTGASIGAKATVLPGVTVGRNAMVDAGARVTRDVASNAIVAGNPGRVTGFVEAGGRQALVPVEDPQAALRVYSARLVILKTVIEARGSLTMAEAGQQLPFAPQRFFSVYGVPGQEVRGRHAHRTQHQFLVCLQGSCHIVLDDGRVRDEVKLGSPSLGLHVPPMIWGIQYKYSPEAVLLVLNSGPYDRADYISSYDEFMELANGGSA